MDLLFHDESAKVERKSKGRPSESATASTSAENAVAAQRLVPVNLTNIVVYQPWDDLGIHFFMSNYVGKDPAVSQLYYLPDFYAKLGYATSSLKKTIIASGLAGYARTARRQDLIEQSTRTYVAAIRDINTALSSPQHAVNDTTLMSIMMAAMFETMLVSPEAGMHNVSKHLEGAMSVAYLSLQQRPPSDVFKALLSTLVQSVIMNCWIQHVPLPARYKSIRPYVPDRINPHSVHAKLVDVLSRVIEFRDDLKEGQYQSPTEILQRALKVDADLKTFIDEMPTHTCFEKCWMPTVQATEVQQLVYNWVFHGTLISALLCYPSLMSCSLPTTICWPPLEQCSFLPHTSSPTSSSTMLYTALYKRWGRILQSAPTEVSLGVTYYSACWGDLRYSPAITLVRRLPKSISGVDRVRTTNTLQVTGSVRTLNSIGFVKSDQASIRNLRLWLECINAKDRGRIKSPIHIHKLFLRLQQRRIQDIHRQNPTLHTRHPRPSQCIPPPAEAAQPHPCPVATLHNELLDPGPHILDQRQQRPVQRRAAQRYDPQAAVRRLPRQ